MEKKKNKTGTNHSCFCMPSIRKTMNCCKAQIMTMTNKNGSTSIMIATHQTAVCEIKRQRADRTMRRISSFAKRSTITTTTTTLPLLLLLLLLVIVIVPSLAFSNISRRTMLVETKINYNKGSSRINYLSARTTPSCLWRTRLFSSSDASSSSSRLVVLDNSQNCSNSNVVELQFSEFIPQSQSESSHPPVIFLHGLLGNKRNFASLASSLSSQLRNPRRIYTLDLRNHGENTHDWRSSMSYSEMARDVLAFMDKQQQQQQQASLFAEEDDRTLLQNQSFVLVGHSMGGKVAQCLALMYPERVAGLVVLDIAPVRYYSGPRIEEEEEKGEGSSDGKEGRKNNGQGEGDGSGWKAVEEIVRSVAQIDLTSGQYATKRDVDAALRQGGALEDPALRAFVLTNLEQVRTTTTTDGDNTSILRWKINWDGIVQDLDRIAGFDVHDQGLDVKTDDIINNSNLQYMGDVFFIHGGASRFVRHSHISTIASYFPNHMLTTIRGVGHWVHAEAPDDTIALLKRYLDR